MITIPPGAYKLASLNDEIKRNIIENGCFTEENNPFVIKPNFSTLGSNIEIIPSFIGSQNSFVHGESMRYLSGFTPIVIYDKYSLSNNPVDIFYFDNIFLETDIARGMIFKR